MCLQYLDRIMADNESIVVYTSVLRHCVEQAVITVDVMVPLHSNV
jgi:hypothetical protein